MISSYVAGSHELSPQINYLLHNKLLSSQQQQQQHQSQHQRRQSVVSQSGYSSGARSRSHSQPASRLASSTSTSTSTSTTVGAQQRQQHQHQHPPQATDPLTGQLIAPLPPIRNSSPAAAHLNPLTVHEYERRLRLSASHSQLVERVFRGGMQSNRLRAALWPNLFGLVAHRGHFRPLCDGPLRELPDEQWTYVEHAANEKRWHQLETLYYSYQAQWKCITPDQEQRFSAFRERKSLIERDVIRSDRSHPFYGASESSRNNLNAFTQLLMTYMMYDFDIGYMQGMSDLAAPILFVYQGDQVKAFWVFVEVMKLLRRNFEPSQKTIHFQLTCLYTLIRDTDPVFADYLHQQEASNCFFVFRAIMCQFKRELMKNDEDDYSNVLKLWDTIWCVSRLSGPPPPDTNTHPLHPPPCSSSSSFSSSSSSSSSSRCSSSSSTSNSSLNQATDFSQTNNTPLPHHHHISTTSPKISPSSPMMQQPDSNQADQPRHSLTDTELFVLALCLSMIRRERDLMLARRLDSTEIHLHFIDPYLTKDLNGFIEHANQIYSYLKNDFDHSRFLHNNHSSSLSPVTTTTTTTTAHHHQQPLHNTSKPLPTPIAGKQQQQLQNNNNNNYESPYGSAGSYDLLSDFLIINGASGS